MREATWWDIFWNRAGQGAFNRGDTMNLMVLAAGLLVLAVGIGTHVYLKQRETPVSLRGAASHLTGLVWLVPVAALFLFVAVLATLWFSHERQQVVANRPLATAPPGEYQVAKTDAEWEAARRQEEAAVQRIHQQARVDAEWEAARRREHDTSREMEPISVTAREINLAVPAPVERPQWVEAGPVDEGERQLVVVEGRQFPEKQRARQDALDAAVQVVRADAGGKGDLTGRWTLSPQLVQSHAVKDTFVEPIRRSTEHNQFYVYRAYHLVELSPAVRDVVFQSWRNQTVDRRLWVLGGLLGFVTLMLGTAAGYLRLDMWTGGHYRRRLKLASVSLLAAGGLGLAALLPLA